MGSFFIKSLAQTFYEVTQVPRKTDPLVEGFDEHILPNHFLDVDRPKRAASQDPEKAQP